MLDSTHDRRLPGHWQGLTRWPTENTCRRGKMVPGREEYHEMGGGERKKHCSIAMKEFEENLGKGITLTPQQENSFFFKFFSFFFFVEEIETITENQH